MQNQKLVILNIGVLALIVVMAGVLFLRSSGQEGSPEVAVDSDEVVTDEQVLAQLETIMELPAGEPMMAIVEDADSVRAEQPEFFAKAENGHRVIIYPSIAILYDEEKNRIIHSGSVSFTPVEKPPTEEVAPEAEEEEEVLDLGTFSYVIWNGSGVAGDAAAYAAYLEGVLDPEDVALGNASNRYAQTTVIALSEDVPAAEIASSLGATIGTLPPGELSAEGDVLIIVGRDFDAP